MPAECTPPPEQSLLQHLSISPWQYIDSLTLKKLVLLWERTTKKAKFIQVPYL